MEINTELKKHLDEIVTMLSKGEIWHKKAANECRKIGIRGMGRYHDEMGINDAMELFYICKIISDKLKHYPETDYSQFAKAETYTINNHADFKRHFAVWDEHEKELINKITAFLPHAMVDVELYEKLIHILKSTQNERFRANLVRESFEFGNWNMQDISNKSMILHDYFEHHYKNLEPTDFNIG